MESILDSLMRSLQSSGGIGQISRSSGIDEADVSKVLAGALPALLAGLDRNTNTAEGASGLLAALDRDHDGSIMDDLAGLLAGAGSAEQGPGILRHTFGDQQVRVEDALSRSTGVDMASIGKILAMIAPMVLGYLGRQRHEQGLDASGLSAMLTQEKQIAQQRSPEATSLLTRLLDSDDDGSVADDLAKMGADMLGSLFRA